jgi:hypothetical protein
MRGKQQFDLGSERIVTGATLVNKGGTLFGRSLHCGLKNMP